MRYAGIEITEVESMGKPTIHSLACRGEIVQGIVLSGEQHYQITDFKSLVRVEEVVKSICDCGAECFAGANEEPFCSKKCEDRVNGAKLDNEHEEASRLLKKSDDAFRERVISNHIDFALSCGVSKRHASCTLKNYSGDMREVLEWAKKSDENILIQGTGAGNGKTHLSVGALKHYAMRETLHKPCICFASFTELMNDIKSTFGSTEITDKDVINLFKDVDLLIIDDIGAEKVSDYAQSILYIILNRRYEDVKPTILTTNLTAEQINDLYGHRLLSRMISGDIVSVYGSDNRVTKFHDRELASGLTVRKSIIEMVKEKM